MATLLVWQFFPVPFEATNKDYQTQQKSVSVPASEKPPITDTRHFQGILVTQADIKEMITVQFTKYGIENEIPTALKVLDCESGYQVNASNGISFGIFQFTKSTWHDFGHGDIYNPMVQVEVATKMWKNGLQSRWDYFTGKR